MSQLSLILLGQFSATLSGEPITAFRTDKVRALLAYLALESNQLHSRHTLAGLLWPDLPERHSLDNVRVTLHRLRQTLNAAQPGLSDEVLTITRQTIQFNGAAARVDVADFEAALAKTASQDPLHLNAPLLAQLAQGVALYRGELLAGFSLPDAPTYEEWLLLRREQLAARALLALRTLADAYETLDDLENAFTYTSRLLELDPYGETARRQLMRILARRGLPDQALAQYATLRRLLRDELGVEPNEQTVALYEQIRDGKFVERTPQPQTSTTTVALPPTTLDVNEIPFTGSFVGRGEELSRLSQWVVQDRCRVVMVLGLGGVGKTSLVAHAARAAAGHFERVLWRSLLNAPPLEMLLAGLLQTLAEETLTNLPTTLDEQFALLFSYLRTQRVLLILDNLESTMDPSQAGHFRPDYELYDQLFWQAATSEHRSALLLTSRERPGIIARLTGDSPLVQSLLLRGLDEAASLTLLSERGVSGPSDARSALIARYSGNPLALKLVADTVQELFAGDVESFLAEDTVIFDDVRAILEQQFNRLTELEQTILFWLAVARETIDAQTLRHYLVQPPGYAFLESLRSLQHRTLIERHHDGIGLQNVVMEYLTDRLVETLCAEIHAEQPNLLHRHALLKSQASDDVRRSQVRLILAPIAAQLQRTLGKPALEEKLGRLLDILHQTAHHLPSYAAGNLLNLLLHLEVDITGYDFSHLCVWQADLRGANLAGVNFAGADLSNAAFTEDFGLIFSVAIHPQGHLLAAGGAQGTVRIWSLATGQSAGLLTGHTNAVTSVAWSQDGTRLVSGSLDRRVRVWDWQTGRCLQVLVGHRSGVFAIAISQDGSLIASAGQDRTVRLWDVGTGQQIDMLNGQTDVVLSLAFHPTGSSLALASMDHSVYLWNLSSPPRRASAPEISSSGQSVDTVPGINTGQDNDTAQRLKTLHVHGDQVLAVAFSPDGSLLASGSGDATVCLWNLQENQALATLRGHTHWVRSVIFSPDGSRIISGSADRTIRIWDVASQRTLEVLRGHEHTVRSVAMHPDGSILASGGLDDTIRLWDLRRPQHDRLVRTIRGYVAAIGTLAISPDGKHLATGDGKGWVRLWPVGETHGAPTPHTLPGRGMQVNCVSFSPDGRWLASADDDRLVRIWETSSLQTAGVLHGHREAVHTVRFSPQGEMVATAGYEGSIYLWDFRVPTQARIVKVLSGHTQQVNDLLFTPDGKHLISGATDLSIRNWEVATGRCVQVIEEADGQAKTLALDAGRSLLAAAGWAGIIRLYHLNEQNILEPWQRFQAHATRIGRIAFSPDGTRLISGGQSGTVRLWDVETCQQLLRLHGHTQPVQAVAFFPDGDMLASAGDDETVRLWALDSTQTSGRCVAVLRVPGPYARMNIRGVTGISEAQRASLKALGAVDTP